jgi:hypothetical protein
VLVVPLLAPVSCLFFVEVFAVFAAFGDVLLFCWCEEAAGDFFKEFVGNLLCAVAESLEG